MQNKSVMLAAAMAAVILALAPGGPAALAAPTAAAAGPAVVDASTLTGKVMCGYQGWFNAPGDGSDRGWRHFGPALGKVGFDLWPDMTDYPPDDRYPTEFKNADGTPAALFSSRNPATEDVHFRWMREYGIDGVFVQRFASATMPVNVANSDAVLENVRASAKKYGRVYGLMYDLSGVKKGSIGRIIDDWKHLVDTTHLTKDGRFIREGGKPVVALWGIGFGGSRDPLLDDALQIIQFLHDDPVYGGNLVMIGVPRGWRTQDRPDAPNAKMLAVAQAADIVSPWAVGTYHTPEEAVKNADNDWTPDLAWCKTHGREYMPVVYPGFSWYNLRHGTTPFNQIPRAGGRFLWAQYVQAKRIGATMVYQAMFDEVDEGTAILKVTNTPPNGQSPSKFVTYEGLPSDFYLRMVGEGTRLIRGEIGPRDEKLIGKYGTWTGTLTAEGK